MARPYRIFNKKRYIASLTVMSLFTAGLVFAAWTTNGTGTAYAEAGTASPLTTIDVSASTTPTLYPGVSGDVLIRVNNPNSFAVRVTAVAGNGAITPDAGHSGCTTTGVTFTNQTGLTIDVPASSATTATMSGAASMSNASVNACQGAKFTIPVSLTGTSN